LVRNKWTKKGSRQSVSKYLGRVYNPEKINDIEYYDYIKNNEEFINNSSSRKIVESLVGWVLSCHGFAESKGIWSNENYIVNIKNLTVKKEQKNIVLEINNDFLCNYTLRKLGRYKSGGDREVVGVSLAKAFINAGIPVPQDVFVNVFQKVYKKGQSYVK